MYQQDPAEATLCEWPAEFFGDWMWLPAERWPRDFKYRVVCLDASKGHADKPGDYSAIVFIGVGADGLLYVDAIIDRIPLDQVVRRTIAFCDHYRPDHVGIEAEQFQELLVHEFRRQCGDFQRRWSVWMMKTAGVPKVARIRRLTHYINAREFRFQSRFARLPAAGRSAHGLSVGGARRRPGRAGDVYAVAGGIEAVEVEAG